MPAADTDVTDFADPADARPPRWIVGLAVALCLFTVAFVYVGRLIGPNDLYRKDQGKTMAYTVDVIRNGRFSLPRDPIFQPATKPPLYNWLAAAFCGPTGIYDEWAHKLPSLLGSLAIAAMVFVWSRRRFSDAIGRGNALLLAAFAATIWIASKSTILLMYIARPDMVQAVCLVGAWLAGHAALSQPTKRDATRWAVLYWLAVTAAAMAKGPAAIYPILYVLLAAPLCFGEWRRIRNLRWIPGLIVLFGTVGLWLLCAYRQDPGHVKGVLIGTEVVKRIAASNPEGFVKPWHYAIMWFIAQNTVWSYLMLGSMVVSLLGSIRRLMVGDGIRPHSGRLEERTTSDQADSDGVGSGRAPTLDYAAPLDGRTPVARFFDLLCIRPSDGFFTGAAGAANLWALVVVGCLSIPKDKRMDFLLPGHPAAAILAANFIVFLISRFPWTRFALPLAAAVFLLDEKRSVGSGYVHVTLLIAVAVVVALIFAIRRAPRLVVPVAFAVAAICYFGFEVATNTRLGVARIKSPATSYVLLIFGAGLVASLGIAAFRRFRLELPLVACGILFWSYALLQNGYKDTNLPQRQGATGVHALLARIYSPDPEATGTGPGVYAARFAKQARAIVGDTDPLVMLVRSKSPILSLMGRHQGSYLTHEDFEKAKWVIAERSKFPQLNDPHQPNGVPDPKSQEKVVSGILDVDYGSIVGTGDIYKDRLGLYQVQNGVPSVDQLISIFRWVTSWTTKDANPYRSPNTGWIEGPNDPPMWTPPAGDPWSDPKLRKKGARGGE